MNTHETYVSLEVAKLLKQAGFDWDYQWYHIGKNTICMQPSNNTDITLSVAQKWLREVACLDIIVDRILPSHEMKYSYEYEYTVITADGIVEAADCYFEEYEEALEAGIKKALEILLEKGE